MLYSNQEYCSLKEYFSLKPVWVWAMVVILLMVGFGFGGYGVYELVSTNDQEIVTSNDISSQVCEQTADFGQITVYISGAVVKPGVYILESGSRIVDLLVESGGISDVADVVYVNRQFNLAKRLSDGDQIYIPTQHETEKQIVAVDTLTEASNTSLQGLISINSSTMSELMELSGIGEARATKIIENRPYSSSQELVEKGVLSSTLLEKIASQISI